MFRRFSGSFCAWCENNNWGVFLLLAPHSDTKWRRLIRPATLLSPRSPCQTMHVRPHGRHGRQGTVIHTHQTASNFSIELNPSFSLIKATTSEPSNRPLNGRRVWGCGKGKSTLQHTGGTETPHVDSTNRTSFRIKCSDRPPLSLSTSRASSGYSTISIYGMRSSRPAAEIGIH